MTRRPLPTTALIACLSISALLETQARADDDAVATELFNAGRDLMKAGDYASACPKLTESVRLKPTVGALAKLAGCEEAEHHLVSARARWEQALNLAHSIGDDREASVRVELARLDAVVPKIAIAAMTPLPEKAIVRLDGHELGAGSVGVALPVEAGAHELVVAAPSKRPWSAKLTTANDGALTRVEIPALEDEPVVAPVVVPTVAPPPPPPVKLAEKLPPPRPMAPGFRAAGYVVGAAGVVGLGLGTAFGVAAIHGRNAAGCTGSACPTNSAKAQLESAQSWADASTAAFVAGGLLVAAGVTVWVVAPRTEAPSKPTLALAPSGLGVVALGQF